MKIRTGFVSNSSSSSFLCAVGEIKNYEKVKEIVDNFNKEFRYLYVKITDTNELIEYLGNVDESSLKVTEDRIIQKASANSEPKVSIKFDPSIFKHYIIIDISNDEGDSRFYVDPENPSGCDFALDYSKAQQIEYFPPKQQELYHMIKNKNFIAKGDVIFGAERNG